LKNLIVESLINNTDCHIENNDETYKYVPRGQALEVGLINFLIDNKDDVVFSFIDRNRYAPKHV
jgi:hypothetical protein